MRCAMVLCNSNNQAKNFDHSIRFFTFSKDPIVKRLWVNACCRQDTFNVETARVCSNHFKQDDYERNLKYELLNYIPRKGLKQNGDAVPSVNLPKYKKSPTKIQVGRQERASKRDSNKIVQDILAGSDNQHVVPSTEMCTPTNTYFNKALLEKPCTSKASPVGQEVKGVNTDSVVWEELNNLQQENRTLKENIMVLEQNQLAFNKLFTDRQIGRILNSKKRPIWSVEEISQGIAIYSAGPRAYRLLLKKGYPYPAISTLRSCSIVLINISDIKNVFHLVARYNFNLHLRKK